MRPNAAIRQVHSVGVSTSADFGISQENEVHIMSILRDTLYSNKILAVLREYSANAWDANREIGKHEVPIKVTLPSDVSPILKIRDFGPGLSPDDIRLVYTQYGSSTKRNSDSSVGMLGIGSKAAFSYTDSFTVTSWFKGSKRVYVAVLDETNRGKMDCIHEELCELNDSGVEITVAVDPKDTQEFHEVAKELFRYFRPQPEINTKLETIKDEQINIPEGIVWKTRYGSGDWTAVMGCIPYKIDLNQIIDKEIDGEIVGTYIGRFSGILNFNIGELEFSASREALKYSNRTKVALIQKINKVADEYVRITIENLRNSNLSFWERRVQAQLLVAFNLPIPDEFKEEVKSVVKIDPSKSFSISHVTDNEKTTDRHLPTTTIAITKHTHLFLRDDIKSLAGYSFMNCDYIVRAAKESTWDQIKLELDELLAKARLTGIPIKSISTLPWHDPRKPKRVIKKSNPKHSARLFELIPDARFTHPYSESWKMVIREPTPEDVWVVIDKFKALNYKAFYADYVLAKKVSEIFTTSKLPTVYGYKYKNSLNQTQLMGRSFNVWLCDFKKSLKTSQNIKDLNVIYLSKSYSSHCRLGKNLKTIINLLGQKHLLVKFLGRQYAAYKKCRKIRKDRYIELSLLGDFIDFKGEDECSITWSLIKTRYPLFREDFAWFLLGKNQKAWTDYIKLVDQHLANEGNAVHE